MLGETYNQNESKKQQYSPTVYSPYRMSNVEDSIDRSCINFTYWNNTLKISIAPKKPSNNDEVSFDYENAIAIYLNHTKARILHDEICKFQEDPEKYNSSGIPSGQGLITISNGKEFGIACPCIVIRKVDESGMPTSSYAYQIKNNYYYSIRNYDEKKGTFDKVTSDYANIELEQIKTLLMEYYKAMTGAIAYSVLDQNKYDTSRMSTKIDQIASKLGVQFGGAGGGGNYKSSTSAFNSRPATNYTSSTLDDISREMDERD